MEMSPSRSIAVLGMQVARKLCTQAGGWMCWDARAGFWQGLLQRAAPLAGAGLPDGCVLPVHLENHHLKSQVCGVLLFCCCFNCAQCFAPRLMSVNLWYAHDISVPYILWMCSWYFGPVHIL